MENDTLILSRESIFCSPVSTERKPSLKAPTKITIIIPSIIMDINSSRRVKPLFFINLTPFVLCGSSLFLSFWLVQNLSSGLEQFGRISANGGGDWNQNFNFMCLPFFH